MYGKHHSEYTKSLIGNANKGRISVMRGKTFPQDVRNKISIKLKEWRESDGYVHPMLGKHHSDKAKFAVSNANKGRASNQRKQVYQFNINNNIINTFHSVDEASKYLNISAGSVSRTCSGVAKSNVTCGYKLSFNKEL